MERNLQSIAEEAMKKMGVTGQFLAVLPVEDSITQVASALGVKVDIQPGIVWAVGIIFINKQKLDLVSTEEWNFVMHHECAHIFRNDSIASLIFNIPELYAKYVEIVDKNNLPKLIIDLVKSWDILVNQKKPMNAQLLRMQELEADKLAVKTMRNKKIAIQFFTRISNGNMNGSSHDFELFYQPYPALTWGERIAALEELKDY